MFLFQVAITKVFFCRAFSNGHIWIPSTFDDHQPSLQRRLLWAELHLSSSLWLLGWETTEPPCCYCRHCASSLFYFDAATLTFIDCGPCYLKKGFVSGLIVNLFMRVDDLFWCIMQINCTNNFLAGFWNWTIHLWWVSYKWYAKTQGQPILIVLTVTI